MKLHHIALPAVASIALPLLSLAQDGRKAPEPVPQATIDSLKAVVEASPDSIGYHEKYIKALGGKVTPELVAQYKAWAEKFPKSKAVPYAIGQAYYNHESPEATPYLKQVVKMDPKFARVWQMLSIDAERWGNEALAHEYMGKAAAAEPTDAGYAFYYAMDYEHTDPAMWRTKLWELTKRFPDQERGAQGLYWLAFRSRDEAEKLTVFESLRTLYPPNKFNWSSSGMSGLFDIYLKKDPQKAIALAKDMGTEGGWPAQVTLAENVAKAKGLLEAKNYKEAANVVSAIKLPRYSQAIDMLVLLKAEATAAAGNLGAAYDSVAKVAAKTPSDELYAALDNYGAKLGKDKATVQADIWKLRDAAARPAPAFELGLYTSDKKSALKDYQGKVVLLTFWFPGCGPCRGEFPHFQEVVNKYDKKQLSYLGINVFPEQDDYVVPFMKGTKYSFIPLRGTSEWAADVYKVRGEPTNFLIDQNGNIVYSNFMINVNNQRMLELMINSLVERKSPGKTDVGMK